MKKYLSLLQTQRNLRLLCTIQLICYFGAWFSHVGIFTLLSEFNAPIWAITLTAAGAYLPGVILSPFSGILIDKFSPKPMLIAMMLIETVSVLVLVFITSLDMIWLIIVIVFVRIGVSGVYFQVEMSLLPRILNKDELKLANEIHSIIWAGAYTIGMSLSGVFIHFFGVKAAFLFDFALYLTSFYFLFQLLIPDFNKNVANSAFKMLKDGVKYIKHNKIILHLILLHSFVGLTTYDAILMFLAKFHYASILSIPLAIGFMNATRSLSLMIGPTILSKFMDKNMLFYIFIAQGAGIVLWAFLQFNFYLGLVGMIFAGFFTSSLWSYTYMLLQINCKERFYGRVIAYNDMLVLLVSALFSFFVGFLFENGINLFIITCLMGGFFFIGAIYYKFVKNNYIF